ncbi:MAG: hypothetical protein ACRC0L_00300 [Angustibacter sp.]
MAGPGATGRPQPSARELTPFPSRLGVGSLSVVDPLSEPILLPLWQVTLTVSGKRADPQLLASSLEQLSAERPFMMAIRYAEDRAELQYWDEAEDVDDAAALALRLWGDHRRSCDLPAWRVVGIEVLDRATVQARGNAGRPSAIIGTGVSRL